MKLSLSSEYLQLRLIVLGSVLLIFFVVPTGLLLVFFTGNGSLESLLFVAAPTVLLSLALAHHCIRNFSSPAYIRFMDDEIHIPYLVHPGKTRKIRFDQINSIEKLQPVFAPPYIAINYGQFFPLLFEPQVFSEASDLDQFYDELRRLVALHKGGYESGLLDKVGSLQRRLPISSIIVSVLLIGIFVIQPQAESQDQLADILLNFGALQSSLFYAGEYFRLTTPLFLHANAPHLFFNLCLLLVLGLLLEGVLGWQRFVTLLLLSGIASSFASLLWYSNDVVVVGTSGAIYGLVGTFFLLQYRFRKELPNLSTLILGPYLLPTLIVIEVLWLWGSFEINLVAHLAGISSGILFAYFLIGRTTAKSLLEGQSNTVLGVTTWSLLAFYVFNSTWMVLQ